ncbi:MAG: PAS domain S-box protein [Myxococcales bacterium]|nr:MAG: PAS domain S-box protein [Myxococcales bacterium]
MAHVLIIDDERGIRYTLSEFLSQDGHQVETTGSVEHAEKLIGETEFDVIVLDIVLPKISGIEFLETIRKQSTDVQVILISGEPTVQTAIQAMRMGAFDFLAKPISGSVIRRVVGHALRVKSLKDENRRLLEENIRHREHLEELVRQQTQEIRDSEARYGRLTENLPDMVWRTTFDGTVLYVNQAVRHHLGREPAEAVGMKIQSYLSDDSIGTVQAAVLAALKSEPPTENFRASVRYKHRDGRFVDGEINVTMLRDETGRVATLEGITRDISERLRYEETIETFAALVDNFSEFVGMADPDGRVSYLNRAGRELVGLAPDFDVQTLNIADFVFPEDRDHMRQEAVSTAIETGLWRGAGRIRHFAAGDAIPVAITTFLVRHPKTKLPMTVATIMRRLRETDAGK